MLGRTDSPRRLLAVLAVFVLVSVSLVGRLAWWQVIQHDQLALHGSVALAAELFADQIPVAGLICNDFRHARGSQFLDRLFARRRIELCAGADD